MWNYLPLGQGRITLFQNQCFLHRSIISSMGTPFVSGKNMQTKRVMMVIHPAKKRKMPYIEWGRGGTRKTEQWQTWRRGWQQQLCSGQQNESPVEIFHSARSTPKDPHDHPKAATNRQMTTTTKIENPLDSSLSLPNLRPRMTATTILKYQDTTTYSVSRSCSHIWGKSEWAERERGKFKFPLTWAYDHLNPTPDVSRALLPHLSTVGNGNQRGRRKNRSGHHSTSRGRHYLRTPCSETALGA